MKFLMGIEETYKRAQDVFRHGRQIDAGVLVRLEVGKRIVRDALGDVFLCAKSSTVSPRRSSSRRIPSIHPSMTYWCWEPFRCRSGRWPWD